MHVAPGSSERRRHPLRQRDLERVLERLAGLGADGHQLQTSLEVVVRRHRRQRFPGSPRRGLYFIQPDPGYPDKPVQVWTQGQDEDSRHYWPGLDIPAEKATSEVLCTAPRGLFVLSNGELRERTDIDGGGVAVEDLAIADLNGDGKPDIVAVGRQTKNVRIYWNQRP